MFLYSAFYILSPASAVSPPTLYFEGPPTDVRPGAEFTVTLFVDSVEAVNAYSLHFGYPKDLLELVRFNDSRSIITVWRNQPSISESGVVAITGGSLKPFRGERGEIITITFQALTAGTATLRVGDSALYLANGKGTRVDAAARSLTFQLRESAPPFDTIAISDTQPPAISQLALTDDPFHEDRQFVGFVVEDKETGVQGTFVRIRRFLLWGEWERAQNPTAIPRSAWAVGLRAVDNAENVSEAVIYNWQALRGTFLLVLIVLFVAAVAVINTLKQRRRRYTKGG